MAYNKYPAVRLAAEHRCLTGWETICRELETMGAGSGLITIECYQGVYEEDIHTAINQFIPGAEIISTKKAFREESDILALTYPDVTDDRIFGRITTLQMQDLMDADKINDIREDLDGKEQLTVIIGPGAALITESLNSTRIFADMARWEIQMRMRRKEIPSLGLSNASEPFETLYKRGFFLDWRICDALKRKYAGTIDYWLDTNTRDTPKMINRDTFEHALTATVSQPFSVVPFFDPGPWGGQWMKEHFGLDNSAPNYAWCFNCVPEENSLLIDVDGCLFETPSINVVFFKPDELLGSFVRSKFGEEFPIRFDFLDTINGGNLSLQVHPDNEYIRDEFNMPYTQDESYYMLDAEKNATVYLGLKSDVDKDAMMEDLLKAQHNGHGFQAELYSEEWPARKHDHFLIPAGTVHCSGKGCMVLEISATPYIFTFKLWDWGRLGMDGKPRPINIERGKEVIQWDRQTEWTRNNLINNVQLLDEGPDWREERTGLHNLEFIETRRHWHSGTVSHVTGGTVNVLMLVEGKQAIVESPSAEFDPFVVNYAEAFIIPAKITNYTIRPYGESEGKEIATLKAYVRDDNH